MTEVLEAPASTDLAIIETGVAELTPTARALAELQHRLKGIAYPALNTGAGMQAAIDDRRALIDLRVGLGKLVEAANKKDRADTKARCEARDAGCLKLTGAIKALEEPIDQQIKAEEARKAEEKRKREEAEAARKAAHESGIARIRAYAVKAAEPGMTSERIAAGIAQVEAMTFTAEAWEEYAVPAANAQCETIQAMKALRDKALASESAAAEAERVRQENERRAAELAEQQRQLAEQRAAIERERAELEAARALQAQQPDTREQAPQQVLKAEAETPDATDRGASAHASPCVGTMGAGQAADAAPAAGCPELAAAFASIERLDLAPVIRPAGPVTMVEPSAPPADEKPTLKLGELNDWLAPIQINAAGLAELGISHSGTDKSAKLYRPSDRERIRLALIEHLEGLK